MMGKSSIKKYGKAIIIGSIVLLVSVSVIVYLFLTNQSATHPGVRSVEVVVDPIRYVAKKDSSAFAQLKELAQVETEVSDGSAFIDSINGTKDGKDGKHWTLYIDGKEASAGADAYVPRGGETIEWRFK